MKTCSCVLPALLCISAFASAAPADFPAANGLGPDKCSVLTGWEERAPHAPGTHVYGFRLAPLDGTAPFDVYFGPEGDLLDPGRREALGIQEKDWSGKTVDQEPEPALPAAKALSAPPVPVEWGASLELTLPPVDMAKILLEDDAAKGVERIGIVRDLDVPVSIMEDAASEGAWRQTPDGGWIWSLCIRSTGAFGQRIHFTELALPEAVRLIVYNDTQPEEAYGPFESAQDFWTPTCFGEGVTIECYAASGASRRGLYLEIDRTTHNYKDLLELAKAGTCNNDLACFPEWTTVSYGVGGIGSIGDTGSLWCTGSLVADAVQGTQIPYFLTANHCVGSVSEASSIEVYWLYQRSTCNGVTPAVLSVPRTTGGADFLASSTVNSGTDFTLLRLRNTPPSGVSYLGFRTEAPGVGENVLCIHHPQGEHKRISFGTKTESGSPALGGVPMEPYARFHEVLWNDGTTEPGSSGSPLMLLSSGKIIGQLYGGRASCSAVAEPDYFGRFDVTYPVIEQYLGPEDVFVVVPDLFGRTQAEAVAVLQALGLTVGVVNTAFSDTVPEGHILAQDVAPDVSVLLGTAVGFTLSNGPAHVVPEVVGLEQAEAEAAVLAANLVLGTITEVYSVAVPAGRVISQDPAAGTLVKGGSAVNLHVSKGAEPCDVNASGTVDVADVQQVLDAALLRKVWVNEDLDGSATVDAADIQLIVNALQK